MTEEVKETKEFKRSSPDDHVVFVGPKPFMNVFKS